jgi:hypothetical protein
MFLSFIITVYFISSVLFFMNMTIEILPFLENDIGEESAMN